MVNSVEKPLFSNVMHTQQLKRGKCFLELDGACAAVLVATMQTGAVITLADLTARSR
jgi:hypothetical protein